MTFVLFKFSSLSGKFSQIQVGDSEERVHSAHETNFRFDLRLSPVEIMRKADLYIEISITGILIK